MKNWTVVTDESAADRIALRNDDAGAAKIAPAQVLQEADGGVISGWGWADRGWNGPGGAIYFASTGPHTLRIQQREDGAIFDQIVLSPDLYFTRPPGSQNQDATIVPR